MIKSAETKLKLLTQGWYKNFYDEIKDRYTDDRRLYQNIFEMMLDAVYAVSSIDNTYVWVAFNEQFDKDLKELDDIIERFKK